MQKICVIWLHGLGSSAENMRVLVDQLNFSNGLVVHNVFLNAPFRNVKINANMRMRAWYDIELNPTSAREDKVDIIESHQQIIQAVEEQMLHGFSAQQIFLAGFSQGGAMALYTALHANLALGGIISLSAYLPVMQECQATLPLNTPFFLALGNSDTVVVPDFTRQSGLWLKNHGYINVAMHEYAAMEHTVCQQELIDLAEWLFKYAHFYHQGT